MDTIYHSEDREILRDLLVGNKAISIFVFHQKYLLSPGQLARVARKYSEMGIIAVNGDHLSLTDSGRAWVIRNRRKIFRCSEISTWKKTPDEFKKEYKDSEMYMLPSRKKIKKLLG